MLFPFLLELFPFPFPLVAQNYSHSHGNPMGMGIPIPLQTSNQAHPTLSVTVGPTNVRSIALRPNCFQCCSVRCR